MGVHSVMYVMQHKEREGMEGGGVVFIYQW